MKKFCKYLLGAACSFLPALSIAASPWLPTVGELDLSLGLSQETFRQFWQATQKTDLGAIVIKDFFYAGFVYGITERFAVDLLTGKANTYFAPSTRGNLGGRLDIDMGLLFRAIDEFTAESKYTPTVTFRLGGTIKGTYGIATAGNVQAPGNKVNGTQLSILVGKYLPYNFGVFGEFGGRYRDRPVPNALFGNIGIFQTVLEHWTWSVFYNRYNAVSGIDIGKAPFTGAIGNTGFQATKEQTSFLNGSLSYGFNGGQSITFVYAKAIWGRNSGVQSIPSLFVTFPFQT